MMTLKDTGQETQEIEAFSEPEPAEEARVDITKISTLHELLALAIGDFRKVLADERYAINMEVWHGPVLGDAADDRCEVCLAGSVLAKTLQVPPDEDACSLDNEPTFRKIWHNEALSARLYALNDLRCGNVVGAAQEMFDGDNAKVSAASSFCGASAVRCFPYEVAHPTDREGGYALLERLEDLQRKLAEAGL